MTDELKKYPFQDQTLPVAKRVADLVSRLTLEEKLGQLSYQAPAIPRLNIPAYNWWNEALHGVARAGLATVFPQAVGLAATFDPELVEGVATAIGMEGRAKFNAVFARHGSSEQYQGITYWTPNVNIFRDPRWGRGQETYGEDPYLTGRLGAAFVRGLQGLGNVESSYDTRGEDGGDDGKEPALLAAACAKHFAVHSGPEESRHSFDAKVSLKDLYETYLPAFEELVDAGVEAVMGAYNRVNGEPACGSPELLEETLRRRWGFTGHVVSDCWAIRDFHESHGVTSGPVESVALAVNSGCDLNCGDTYHHAAEAIKEGRIDPAQIDTAFARLMRTRFRLGLFDPPESTLYGNLVPEDIDWSGHADLAKDVATRSFVLLKNSDDVLPISEGVRKIYVTGPQAADVDVLMGNYYGIGTRFTTFLEGIARRAGHEIKVEYRPGCLNDRDNLNEAQWAAFEAEDADVTIAVLGNHPFTEGEEGDAIASPTKGDRRSIEIPPSQCAYLEELRRRGSRIVLVLTGGGAFALDGVEELADAILVVWYPGQAGGDALAAVLFGDAEPSGKLPVSFPKRTEDLPPFDDYRMNRRTYRFSGEWMYPFGFGLGYGELVLKSAKLISSAGRWIDNGEESRCYIPSELFDYRGGSARDGSASAAELGTKEELLVAVEVANQGARETRETVQVYVAHPEQPTAPRYQLCGIQSVTLAPGAQRIVEIPVSFRWLMIVDESGVRYLPESTVDFYIGTAAPGGEKLGAAQPLHHRTEFCRRS